MTSVAEKHWTRECTKAREEPAQCVNCNGDHTANAMVCSAYKDRMEWVESNSAAKQQAKTRYKGPDIKVTDINNMAEFPKLKTLHRERSTVVTILDNGMARKQQEGIRQISPRGEGEDKMEDLPQLVELMEEVRKLNEYTNIPRMLKAFRELNEKMIKCITGTQKFEQFVKFCQQME